VPVDISKLHDVTVIIPTRNEIGCIDATLEELDALAPAAVIVVDDSDDGTDLRVLERRQGRVTLLHRAPEARYAGLGGAVHAALPLVRTPWVVVADGDGQHPLNRIVDLVGQRNDFDLVVASRYLHEGGADGLTFFRHLASRIGLRISSWLHPERLTGLTDPLSGFFLLRLSALDARRVHPDGFKILLEILLSAQEPLRVREVAIPIGTRIAGRSKAGPREVLRLLRVVVRHRWSARS
jgi:dolichol-phosphate mannosyltransferase